MAELLTNGTLSPTTKKRKPDHEPSPGSPTKKSRKEKKSRSSKEKKDRSSQLKGSQEVDDRVALSSQLQPGAASQESKHIPSSTDTDESSPLYMESYSMYLPIAPICQDQPLEAVCAEHLSPLLLSYQNRMNGVVLAYENARLSEDAGGVEGTDIQSKAVTEQASTFIWVTADFLVFRPRRGQRLEGWITLQNDSHIGLTCWNLINASIERKRLPESWTWVDHVLTEGEDFSTAPSIPKGKHGSGHYIDEQGQEVGGTLSFTVADYEYLWMSEAERGLLRVEGTLRDDLDQAKTTGTSRKARKSHKRTKYDGQFSKIGSLQAEL